MIDIALATLEGTKAVRGYTTEVEGLVANRSTWGNGWCVTHQPSGKVIVDNIRTLRDSRNVAKRLAELVPDWAADEETLRSKLPCSFRPQSVLEDGERT